MHLLSVYIDIVHIDTLTLTLNELFTRDCIGDQSWIKSPLELEIWSWDVLSLEIVVEDFLDT